MNKHTNFANFKKYFSSLPPLQQAGFFLWPSLTGETLTQDEINLLKEIKPSGIILFKRNLISVEQSKKLISSLKEILENKNDPYFKPLIISIDEEGGRVSRLPPPHQRGKSALEFADTKNKEGLKQLLMEQCNHAKEIGVNCLLAPVADILTEPKNTVMGDRCFGRDATTVCEYSSFVHKILSQEKMWSCAKHFPGHGNTTTDSHKELATSHVSLRQLKTREWLPFQKLIQENIPFIMAAHVYLPQIDAHNPATLSSKILTQQLRKELGFKGLILSDDLRMNAIALHYNTTKKQDSSITEEINNGIEQDDSYLTLASIDALKAGCDILLSCQSISREKIIAYSIAKKLVEDNEFFLQMAEKAFRILKSKLL